MNRAVILVGDCRAMLQKIPPESVQAIVTSPPYYGLRDYSRCNCAQPRWPGAASVRRNAGSSEILPHLPLWRKYRCSNEAA